MAASRIQILRNPHYKPNGPKSYVYMLNKFGIKPTTSPLYKRNAQNKLIKQTADGTTGTVTADDQQNDSFYTCAVQIGTPAQTLNLDFDSGSSDLWVWSTELPKATQTTGKQAGVAIYDSTKSSTFKNMSKSSWKIQYGDQSSASGTVGTDNVKVGDITVKNQAIELANTISAQFEKGGSSGLLGLAFGTINTVTPQKVKTPVENMIAQQDIPTSASLFTCYLGSVKDTSDPDKGGSFYTFGAIDQSVVKASGQQISYTPIDNSQGFWMFDSTSATVNGQTIDLSGNKAIADTGTTLLMTSDEVCQAIYSQIPGAEQNQQAGGWVFPANTAASDLPTVTFAVGDKQFAIYKEHLGWAPADNSGTTLYGGIQSRGSLGFDIFGDTFLMCVYAIFDVGNTQFGCVQRADPTPDGPTN